MQIRNLCHAQVIIIVGVVAGLALSLLTMCTVFKIRHSHERRKEQEIPKEGQLAARMDPSTRDPSPGELKPSPFAAVASPVAIEVGPLFPNKLAAISTRPGTLISLAVREACTSPWKLNEE